MNNKHRIKELEAELEATKARLDTSDALLRAEWQEKANVRAMLGQVGNFAYEKSAGPDTHDDLWEIWCMVLEFLIYN